MIQPRPRSLHTDSRHSRDGAFFATFPAKNGMEFHTEIGNRKAVPAAFPSEDTRQYGVHGVVRGSVEDW